MSSYRSIAAISILLSTLLFFLLACGEADTSSSASESVIRFAAFGDWGVNNLNQKAVAEALKEKCASDGCDFVLLLGDNFYNYGVSSVGDPKFQKYFANYYSEIEAPFYTAIGNHDYVLNEQAQVEYSTLNPQWIMPALYYSHKHPESNPIADFIALDSNLPNTTQSLWLDDVLRKSQADWQILYAHHQIFAASVYQEAAVEDFHNMLIPGFCGRFQVIISGHEHNKQVWQMDEGNACKYKQIIIGTGGHNIMDTRPYIAQTGLTPDFYSTNFGFGYFEVRSDRINYQLFNVIGTIEGSLEEGRLTDVTGTVEFEDEILPGDFL